MPDTDIEQLKKDKDYFEKSYYDAETRSSRFECKLQIAEEENEKLKDTVHNLDKMLAYYKGVADAVKLICKEPNYEWMD